jgi:phage tail P2-like protein
VTLLPPASTPLERNLEKATTRAFEVPSALRELWNPETCPEYLLPWLAWSLGVDVWKVYWPVEVKRSLLKSATDLKRKKGTVQSVREAVHAFGAAIAIREGWQTDPPGAPHTFSATLSVTTMGDQPITAEFQQDILNEVLRTKPVRSSFTVTASVDASATLALFAVGRAAMYTRLRLTEA